MCALAKKSVSSTAVHRASIVTASCTSVPIFLLSPLRRFLALLFNLVLDHINRQATALSLRSMPVLTCVRNSRCVCVLLGRRVIILAILFLNAIEIS